MAAYAAVTISRTRDLLIEELRKMGEHISLALSVGALHHLEAGDRDGVRNVLEMVSRNPDVLGAAMFDRSGALIASSREMRPFVQDETLVHRSDRGRGYFVDRGEERVYTYETRVLGDAGTFTASLHTIHRLRAYRPSPSSTCFIRRPPYEVSLHYSCPESMSSAPSSR